MCEHAPPPRGGCEHLCAHICVPRVCKFVEVVRVKTMLRLTGEGPLQVEEEEEEGVRVGDGCWDEGGEWRRGISLHCSPVFRGSDT